MSGFLQLAISCGIVTFFAIWAFILDRREKDDEDSDLL